MANVLTDAAVRRFRPAAKRRVIRDGGSRSLYLVVAPSGAKSWMMRFRRPGGRAGKMVLGPLDLSGRELSGDPEIGQPLSLVAARALAAAVHQDRARGRDPVAEHKARRHRRHTEVRERGANAFGILVRRFVEEHSRAKTRSWRAVARLLGLRYPRDGGEPSEIAGSLVERWSDRDVRAIDGADIYGVIDEARRIGVPGLERRRSGASDTQGRAVAAALSKFFAFLVAHQKVAANPCAGTHKPPTPAPRDRVLSDDEIVKFWQATDSVGEPFGAALKLLLLTGARLNEIAGLRFEEIGPDGATLAIPGERTKNKRPLALPLAPLAREIIASVPRIDGSAFVFTTSGRVPIAGWSRIKARIDRVMGDVPAWRIHDLRRTMVTGLAELGVRPDVIELAVNHVSGTRGGIAGVYNRSELLPERRAALERWAAHIEGLVASKLSVVVNMPARGRA